MCDCGYLHRRSKRSCSDGGEVQTGRRRRFHQRNAMLVLWFRDHGYGSADAQGSMGIQRNRTARCGLPGCCAGGSCPERASRFRHLRQGRTGYRRSHHSGRCPAETAAVCKSRTGRCYITKQVLSCNGQHRHGDRRFHGQS